MQKTGGARPARTQKSGKRTALGQREKRRLLQLGLCVGLFFVIFLGKGVAPAEMARSGEALLRLIRTDTDFQGAFTALGEAFSRGDPVLDTLENLVVEVFGGGSEKQEVSANLAVEDGSAARAAWETLRQRPTRQTMLAQLGADPPAAEGSGEQVEQEPPPEPAPEPDPTPQPTPEIPPYTGPALPANATMDYVDLGLTDTVSPVLGVLTSSYGYRNHPVSGEYLFHAGTDLAADTGTPILAFADGTVDFIGEDDSYGLYIQLSHANGVTSFYCHCSALYAQKGQTVAKGETIAAVGETGNATGPHLHLELKRDGVRLNPIYYIETLQ